jgi:predicted regulator of Ras-like GTPase activity (Roadblock/LC7/MglB family)
MFAEMPDDAPAGAAATAARPAFTPAEAELALARMGELSPDLRGCAIVAGDGAVLAASGGERAWGEAAAALLAAADAAGERPAAHVHVATEAGEAFAVRHAGLAMVAVAERFTLASLMVCDMRAVLRDLVAGEGVPDRRKPHPRDLAGEAAEG